MKLNDLIHIIAQELGTSDLKEINKLLKAEPAIKFRITGKALGHFGFTGHIKSLTEEGVKAFMTNKVSLIRYGDIETFEKAKPRVQRPVRTTKSEPVDLDDEDGDFGDEEDAFVEELPKKLKKSKAKLVGKNGSKFIPGSKK